MATVTATFKRIDGQPAAGVQVELVLSRGFSTPTAIVAAGQRWFETDEDGQWSATVAPTAGALEGSPRYVVRVWIRQRPVFTLAFEVPDVADLDLTDQIPPMPAQ